MSKIRWEIFVLHKRVVDGRIIGEGGVLATVESILMLSKQKQTQHTQTKKNQPSGNNQQKNI